METGRHQNFRRLRISEIEIVVAPVPTTSDVVDLFGCSSTLYVRAALLSSFPDKTTLYYSYVRKGGRRGISVHSSFRNDECKSVKGL